MGSTGFSILPEKANMIIVGSDIGEPTENLLPPLKIAILIIVVDPTLGVHPQQVHQVGI